jgi:hypothetical protein
MESYISELDSKRFGFKIAKIPDIKSPPDEIIKEMKTLGAKLIICRVNCENSTLINQLEEFKFKTMDFQVTYKSEINGLSIIKNPIKNELRVREAQNGDKEKLKKIAEESFNRYGHYFADKKLDPLKCLEIYKDWIERSIDSKEVADIVFVAEKFNEIAGFLSFKINQDENLFASGVQGAVSIKFRSQGVFRFLIQQGLIWGSNMHFHREEHNVLATNYPVIKSFINCGFFPYKSFITMHRWLV